VVVGGASIKPVVVLVGELLLGVVEVATHHAVLVVVQMLAVPGQLRQVLMGDVVSMLMMQQSCHTRDKAAVTTR